MPYPLKEGDFAVYNHGGSVSLHGEVVKIIKIDNGQNENIFFESSSEPGKVSQSYGIRFTPLDMAATECDQSIARARSLKYSILKILIDQDYERAANG